MGQPIALVGHSHSCPEIAGLIPHVGGPDTITEGSSTVRINGKAVARLGDPTAHGGTITAGDAAVRVS